MNFEHPVDELLDDWLDGRLAPEERGRLESHLAACERCRRLADALRVTRDTLRAGLPPALPPAGLEAHLRSTLDREDERAERAVVPPARFGRRAWRWSAAAAVVAVAMLAIWVSSSPPADLVAAAERELSLVERQGLPQALRSSQAAEVEGRWQEAALGFRARVFDLAPMGIRLVGGGASVLAGSPAALAVYRGESGLLVCWMLRAPGTPLPRAAEIRRHGEFDFHVYRRGGATLVFWREGDVLCVLAGKGDSEAIVSLALAKAMAPAGPFSGT